MDARDALSYQHQGTTPSNFSDIAREEQEARQKRESREESSRVSLSAWVFWSEPEER